MAGLVAVLVLALLVVASNIASLVFARTWSRSSELAVRTADRRRPLARRRPVVCGGRDPVCDRVGDGTGARSGVARFLVGMMADIPFWMTFEPTLRTMAFVVALSFVISVVSGLLPALAGDARESHRRAARAGSRITPTGFASVGRVLVIEVALSVALLNGALVMARAFASYIDDIPALPKGEVLTARLSGEQSRDVRDRVLAAVRALPGVVSAGAASHLPRQHPCRGRWRSNRSTDRSPSLTGQTPALK